MTRARSTRIGIVVLAVASAFAGGCRRDKRAVRVHTLDGESVVLPRTPRGDVGATRATDHTLHAGGKDRRYTLVAPASADAGRQLPLVLVFHGDGGDAKSFHAAWPFERASGSGAYLAYPEGLRRTWDLETREGNADLAFVDALVAHLADILPIDRARVFATGYSSGGFFANVLACRRPGMLRAITSSAGGAPYGQLEKWKNGYTKCPGQRPTAMLALHGERDRGVRPDSGRFSAEYWAYVNGCHAGEMETTGYPECRVYRGCPAGKAVGLCSIPTLGHWVWDHAAEASWTFFERQ